MLYENWPNFIIYLNVCHIVYEYSALKKHKRWSRSLSPCPPPQPSQDNSHPVVQTRRHETVLLIQSLYSLPCTGTWWVSGRDRQLSSEGTAGGTSSPIQLAPQSFSEVTPRQTAPWTHIWEDYTEHPRVFCSASFGFETKKLQWGIGDAAESDSFSEWESSLYT